MQATKSVVVLAVLTVFVDSASVGGEKSLGEIREISSYGGGYEADPYEGGNRIRRLIKPYTEDNDLLEDNSDRPSMIYREEVKTTVGAMLGQKECLQKAACASGAYLKEVKGKQLIFALLDVFSPTSWKDTVKIAKRSAIFNDTCDYKCLED